MKDPATDKLPTLADVERAASRIAPYAHRTPVLTSRAIDDALGVKVAFKCENFQKVGAFKFRGATNAVFSLEDTAARAGVITHSSGNHAAALAHAAALRGIEAVIVMPDNAPGVKQRAVAGYGAHIEFCPSTQADREATVDRLQAATPRTLIHPYDDARVIAGQGTAALELLADHPGIDTIMTPVGGGGLLAGSTLAASSRSGIRVFGAEPLNADDAARSLRAGQILEQTNPDTIADGLRTSLGHQNFQIIASGVTDIITTSEDFIITAMRMMWERMKIVVEPSAAVPLAALLEHGVPEGCQSIGIVISGGNVDLDELPWFTAT